MIYEDRFKVLRYLRRIKTGNTMQLSRDLDLPETAVRGHLKALSAKKIGGYYQMPKGEEGEAIEAELLQAVALEREGKTVPEGTQEAGTSKEQEVFTMPDRTALIGDFRLEDLFNRDENDRLFVNLANRLTDLNRKYHEALYEWEARHFPLFIGGNEPERKRAVLKDAEASRLRKVKDALKIEVDAARFALLHSLKTNDALDSETGERGEE